LVTASLLLYILCLLFPDFNAIELVWNIIKQIIKNKNPKSQRELENAVDEALNDLSLNVIQACIKKT
jgi:hypothetical protein